MKKYIAISLLILVMACPAHAWWTIGRTGGRVAGGTENLGREAAGGSDAGGADGYMYCYKLEETPTSNGSVDSITTTLACPGSTCDYYLSIYNHDAVNDLPSTVLANSSTAKKQVSEGPSDLTNTYSAPKPAVTSGTQYWLCVSIDGTTANARYYYSDTGGTAVVFKAIASGTFPDWAGSTDFTSANRWFGKLYIVNSW